jgi:hypothetical protein
MLRARRYVHIARRTAWKAMLRSECYVHTMLRMNGYFDVEIRIRRYSICP